MSNIIDMSDIIRLKQLFTDQMTIGLIIFLGITIISTIISVILYLLTLIHKWMSK